MKTKREQPVALQVGERLFHYTYTEPVKDDRKIYWSSVTYWEEGHADQTATFHVSVLRKDLAVLFFRLIEMEIADNCGQS